VEQAPVSFIRLKHNCGKAAALNVGIDQAKGEIVVFSDSDSWLHPAALHHLVHHFTDSHIGAVAGTVLVDKPHSFLKRWQTLEYLFGQAIVKIAQVETDQSVVICPGPIFAVRRMLLVTMGGFKERTLTEDFDATLNIFASGYRVTYEPKAIAYTNAPKTWKTLGRQRLRWSRGNLQVLKAHRYLFLSPKSGYLGLFWLPFYYLFVGYIGSIAELMFFLVFPLILFFSGHPSILLKIAIVYVFLVELFSFIQYGIAMQRAGKLNAVLALSAIFIYPYRFFCNWVRLKAVIYEFRGKASRWSE
jgi:cellulose synthase/poly-beta-1,6-N-acetylglucosamine synthase-like glycosyltransferase